MMNLNKEFKVPAFKIVFFGIIIVAVLFFFKDPAPFLQTEDEIIKIKETQILGERVGYYLDLIERIGPEEAQEELFQSGLPFDGESHLLNHTAGDYIYKEFGSSGLSKCKLYFLASCVHGFVIESISNGGIVEVAKTVNDCQALGSASFSQCVHAIGHGLLASVGYKNLDEALGLCDEVSLLTQNFPSFNCYDGVFMENIWAVHEDGNPSLDRWIDEADLSYPCNDNRIDPKYHLGCWSNQPALVYQLLQGDVKGVSDFCARVEDRTNLDMCFNGLARQIHPIAKADADQVLALCGFLPQARVSNCVITIVSAEYSVGGRELPFALCERINHDDQDQCYVQLLSFINVYEDQDKQVLCKKINNQPWREQCLNKF